MAKKSDGEWKKGQEVEMYEISRQEWVPGKIYDIKEEGSWSARTVYYIEYEEYLRRIPKEESKSLMRVAKINDQSNENDLNEAFLNFAKQIPTRIPLSRQIQESSENVAKSSESRMNSRIPHL